MRRQQGSYTAKGTALHRALESEKRPEERICFDPLARKFAGRNFTACGEAFLPQWVALWIFQMGFPGFHEYFVVRTRHFDEYLRQCIADGLRQVVILGAGYDSRAFRIESMGKNLNFFEVDHPSSQKNKLEKLEDIFGEQPKHVSFVACDFNSPNWNQQLLESGYAAHFKTLFLLEGLTYYLSPDSIDNILVFINKNSSRGSSIIFDYTYPDVIAGRCLRIEAINWRLAVQYLGEELTFAIDKEKIESFLSQYGFSHIFNADSRWLQDRYFRGENQERKISPIFSIVQGRVA